MSHKILHCLGIDCAANARDIGLAHGVCEPSPAFHGVEIVALHHDLTLDGVAAWVTAGLATAAAAGASALLCLDAPLGWPRTMGTMLAAHEAGGAPIPHDIPADALFARETDRFVRVVLGKRPLEVGANYIARTALASLRLLAMVREQADRPVPLAWTSPWPAPETPAAPPTPEAAAAEVYPAAVLAARDIRVPGYKRAAETRAAVLEGVRRELRIPPELQERAVASEHLTDACLCCVAGLELACGRALPPPPELEPAARKEGWIWVTPPESERGEEDSSRRSDRVGSSRPGDVSGTGERSGAC